jgi:hypothetical protein
MEIQCLLLRSVRARVAFAASLALVFASTSAGAGPFQANDTGWEGTSQLLELARERLGRERVALVAQLDYSVLTPRDGVLIIHPEVSVAYEQISSFLRAGGRVAVLDDYGDGARLLSRFRIQRVQAPLRPAKTLRQNANLAVAVPAVEQVAGYEQGRHPIVANVEQLVTNHPTALNHPNLTPVLEIPALNEPDATLAVTGIIAKRGRLFAMGDPSVLINLMMKYPGNRAFAEGLVEYLVEDDAWGPRSGKLYLLSGRFEQQGEYGGESSLSGDVAERLDNVVEGMVEMRESGMPELLALVLAGLSALMAVAWTAVAALRTYRRTTPRYAVSVPLVGQGGVAGRAAVLAAPTTHNALVLLELKSALEEGFSHTLGLAPGASHQRLVEETIRQGALSQPSSDLLKGTLLELNKVAMGVAASQPTRVGSSRVEQVRARVVALLEELHRSKGDEH